MIKICLSVVIMSLAVLVLTTVGHAGTIIVEVTQCGGGQVYFFDICFSSS
jgi:hypothetical protein